MGMQETLNCCKECVFIRGKALKRCAGALKYYAGDSEGMERAHKGHARYTQDIQEWAKGYTSDMHGAVMGSKRCTRFLKELQGTHKGL